MYRVECDNSLVDMLLGAPGGGGRRSSPQQMAEAGAFRDLLGALFLALSTPSFEGPRTAEDGGGSDGAQESGVPPRTPGESDRHPLRRDEGGLPGQAYSPGGGLGVSLPLEVGLEWAEEPIEVIAWEERANSSRSPRVRSQAGTGTERGDLGQKTPVGGPVLSAGWVRVNSDQAGEEQGRKGDLHGALSASRGRLRSALAAAGLWKRASYSISMREAAGQLDDDSAASFPRGGGKPCVRLFVPIFQEQTQMELSSHGEEPLDCGAQVPRRQRPRTALQSGRTLRQPVPPENSQGKRYAASPRFLLLVPSRTPTPGGYGKSDEVLEEELFLPGEEPLAMGEPAQPLVIEERIEGRRCRAGEGNMVDGGGQAQVDPTDPRFYVPARVSAQASSSRVHLPARTNDARPGGLRRIVPVQRTHREPGRGGEGQKRISVPRSEPLCSPADLSKGNVLKAAMHRAVDKVIEGGKGRETDGRLVEPAMVERGREQIGSRLVAGLAAGDLLVSRPAGPGPVATLVGPAPMPTSLEQAPSAVGQKVVEVLRSVRSAEGDYLTELEIYPPELGKVGLRVEVKKRKVNLHIAVESHAVHEVIKGNLAQLKGLLEHRGYHLSGCHLSLSGGNDGRSWSGRDGSSRSVLGRVAGAEGTSRQELYQRALITEEHVDVLA